LYDATGTSMSIAIYVCAMAILSFVCMYALTDTRSVDIDADTPLVGSA
jgi:hypothetical protein